MCHPGEASQTLTLSCTHTPSPPALSPGDLGAPFIDVWETGRTMTWMTSVISWEEPSSVWAPYLGDFEAGHRATYTSTPHPQHDSPEPEHEG